MSEGPYPNNLGKFMRASGLNDPGLANALGISKQQIFNLRRGNRKLTVEWAKRIAPHLKVSWQELITGSPTTLPDQSRADLLARYDAMTEEQRQALLMMARVMVPDPPIDTAPPTNPIPLRPTTCDTPAPPPARLSLRRGQR